MLGFDLVTVNAHDTTLCVKFWCTALDLIELEREDVDRWIVLGNRDGTRRLGVQRGKPTAGSIHLDLVCAPVDFDSEVTKLIALGATLASPTRRESYGSIANMIDPDGYLFDVNAYND